MRHDLGKSRRRMLAEENYLSRATTTTHRRKAA